MHNPTSPAGVKALMMIANVREHEICAIIGPNGGQELDVIIASTALSAAGGFDRLRGQTLPPH